MPAEHSAPSSSLLRNAPELLGLTALLAAALRPPDAWPEGALLVDLGLGAALLAAAHQRRLGSLGGPLLALALGIGAISAGLAADMGAALSALWHEARVLAALWLGLALATREGACGRAAGLLAGAAALASLHALAQVLVVHPALAADPALPEAMRAQLLDGRGNSVFVLPSHLGSFLAAALPAQLALVSGSFGARRVLAAAALLLSVLGLAVAGSFGGLVLAAGAAGLWLLARAGRRGRLVIGAGTLILVGGLAVASLGRREAEVAREAPWTARARNWEAATRLIREAPVFGHGPGSFGAHHPRVRLPEGNDTQHAHQSYLEVAAEQGLGMLALLAALVAAFIRRLAREMGGGQAMPFAMAAGAGVMLAEGLIDFAWMTPQWAIPAACVVGIAWRSTGSAREAPGPAALEPPRRQVVLLAGLLALALPCGVAVGLSRHRAERAQGAWREGRLVEARELLADAARWQPLDDRRFRDRAAIEMAFAGPEGAPESLADAVDHARRAVALSPARSAGHALLAQALGAQGDHAAAAASALRAAGLAPQDASLERARDLALRRAGVEPRGEPR